MDKRVQLKVKIKSLAAEAKIIKKEAAKLQNRARKVALKDESKAMRMFWQVGSLYDHKDSIVGTEARHSLLAYAVLRGKPYSICERKCRLDNYPNLDKAIEMAKRFGANKEQIDEWRIEAEKHLGIYSPPVEEQALEVIEKVVPKKGLMQRLFA